MHLTFMLWVSLIHALIHTLLWIITQPANPVAWLSFLIFWGGSLFNLAQPNFNPLR